MSCQYNLRDAGRLLAPEPSSSMCPARREAPNITVIDVRASPTATYRGVREVRSGILRVPAFRDGRPSSGGSRSKYAGTLHRSDMPSGKRAPRVSGGPPSIPEESYWSSLLSSSAISIFASAMDFSRRFSHLSPNFSVYHFLSGWTDSTNWAFSSAVGT